MFHPTIYDNIKVVLEGAVYDRDLEGEILVTSRSDEVDLATFHRRFQIEFCLLREGVSLPVTALVQLQTRLADIASEQLEQPLTEHVGCTICIHFTLTISDVSEATEEITQILNEIWGHRPHITQEISVRFDEHRLVEWPPTSFKNKVTLDFHRKIDEGNIEDIHDLVEHCIQSITRLNHRFVS